MRASFLIVGAFNAVIQSTPSVSESNVMFALVTIPRSATTITRDRPNRSFNFVTCAGSVLSSCSSPVNTSTATGRPSVSHNRP